MKPEEFLSLLSTKVTISFQDFIRLKDVVDIYDFKKTAHLGSLSDEEFDSALREYDLLRAQNVHHLYPGHPHYPKSFYTLERPPLFLSAIGDLNSLEQSKVSVVGSRYPSHRALEWMELHLKPLVDEGAVLVSGAARGIDQKAHLVSVSNGKPTIAFLPSGLGNMYPPSFEKWKDKITGNGGLIISEYRFDQTIRSHHFHERNRMIAKLGLFLLVCEARRRSGSTMTARLAIENSKTVCVLPGFPSEKNAQGCLDLLFQGALPIRDSEDLKVLLEAERASCRLFVPDEFQSVDCSN